MNAQNDALSEVKYAVVYSFSTVVQLNWLTTVYVINHLRENLAQNGGW
jgi:hypothetical protein